MSPIFPPRLLKTTKRDAFGPGFDDDDDVDDDNNNNNPWGDWNEKSYNGPGGPGNGGSDTPILNGDFGGDGERNNIDFDIEDRVNGRDGLAGGQIAAIVVSIVVFFLLVTGLCFWSDRRRKKRQLEEEQRMADGGPKRDVYMKEQGEELSPVSAVSSQAVGGLPPTPGQRLGGQDAPPPYEPTQPGAAHLAADEPAGGNSNWRQSRVGAEEDDIMVTDGMPPDTGRQQDGKENRGLQIGS